MGDNGTETCYPVGMVIKDEVLRLLTLHKGECVSGERIAGELNVSRNAVWRAVASLRKEGRHIDASTNRGYRLDAGDAPLTGAEVLARLCEARDFYRVEVADSVPSTNDWVKVLAEKGDAEGFVLIARAQTAGKGRKGRSFYSPSGSGLYISVLLRPKMEAAEALSVTTAAAVAVCRAVERVTGISLAVKWVNDLFYRGRKVCGILTEAAFDGETRMLSYAVLGIGLNLTDPPEGFPKEIRGIAGSLFADQPVSDEMQAAVAAAVLEEFYAVYRRLPEREYLAEYRERSCLIGKRVEVHAPAGTVYPVTVLDIDEEARLVARRDDGAVERINGGEVSLLYAPEPMRDTGGQA